MKYVYLFSEGNKDMRNLLGGKGANLAEMTSIGLPVPRGFTVTTEACTAYYDAGKVISKDIIDEIYEKLEELEKANIDPTLVLKLDESLILKLFEVFYTGFKQLQILLTVNVDCHIFSLFQCTVSRDQRTAFFFCLHHQHSICHTADNSISSGKMVCHRRSTRFKF